MAIERGTEERPETRRWLLDWPAIGAWLGLFAATLRALPKLPDMLPVHWGPTGAADAWLPQPLALAVGLGFPAVVYVLTWLRPALVGGGKGSVAPPNRLLLVRRGLVFLCLAPHMVILLASLGLSARVALPIGLGLGLAAIGNVYGLVPPNPYLGTRTPSTLADAVVWRKTHRLTGYLLVTVGLVMASSAVVFGERAFPVLAAGLGVALVGTFGSAALGRPRGHRR